MALHRLTSITLGVPDVDASRTFFDEFGLTSGEAGWMHTRDGGAQLELAPDSHRRLQRLGGNQEVTGFGVVPASRRGRSRIGERRFRVDSHPDQLVQIVWAPARRRRVDLTGRVGLQFDPDLEVGPPERATAGRSHLHRPDRKGEQPVAAGFGGKEFETRLDHVLPAPSGALRI